MLTTTTAAALRAAATASGRALEARKTELTQARGTLAEAQAGVERAQAAVEHAKAVCQVDVERAEIAERDVKTRADAAAYHRTPLVSMLADRLTPEERAIAAARKAAEGAA
jgi:hypothetical protein